DIRHVGPNGATVQRGEDHFEVDMEGATELPVAAIMLDQCAVGMSAAAWWRSDAPLLCHFVWDKLHRVANDLKLSKSKTQNEVMLKTVFIWGANYRPFRSGGFFTEKQEVICAFLDGPLFQSYVHQIGIDCGWPTDTPQEQEYLFNNLMDVAQSFVLKGPMPKTGRWFSWHQSAEVNLKEFHAAKMLLQWYFPSEPDPEESTGKTLASSFKDVGGLKLVYRCMTRKVYELSHVLLAVSKPCWTWYTFQVEEVKTASEQIGYNVLMSEHWMHEPHLCHIASFLSIGCTEFQALMRQSPNEDELVSAASKYVTALLSNRLLATDEMLVRRALRVMREDFTTLVQL
ncbi:unnamed protein product, partial [Effrenium voratum]